MVNAVRKLGVFVLLAALLFVFSVAAEASVITITNRCGDDIHYLYLSDSGTSDWEEDVLGQNVLENGATLQINVQGRVSKFDLRAEDDDDNALEWYGFPGNVTRITLHADGTAEYQ